MKNQVLKHVIHMTKLFTYAFLIQFLTMSLILAENGNAQVKSIEDVLVRLHLQGVDVEEAFKAIELQTGYKFVYTNKEIKGLPSVSISNETKSVYEVLSEIAGQTQLGFKQVNQTINLQKARINDLTAAVSIANSDNPITGKVVDSNGEPLIGVSILVAGTNEGAVTDLDGNFTIDVAAGSVLVVSFIGFETRRIEVGNQSTLQITLSEDMAAMDEFVVVGYGMQRKSDLTGSVTSVPAERLNQIPNNNFAQALQGSMPGVNVTTNTAGAEQNNISILIRGRNSITASNEPLIVWDGIPYTGSISDINPSDIASMEVLKDASATAIYGSRGSNGVILITSKSGSVGKATFTYDGHFGVQDIVNVPRMLTPDEFYAYKLIREPNSMTASEEEIYQRGEFTDWLGLATRQGQRHQHTLAVSGGTEQTKYYISGNLTDVKGVAVNDQFSRYSLRINVETKLTDWLRLGTNTQLSLSDRSGNSPTWGGSGGIFLMNPLTSAYDDNGDLSIFPWPEDGFFVNPISPILSINNDQTYKVFTNNYLQVDFPFIEGLSYRLNTGVEYDNREIGTYYGRNTTLGHNLQGSMDVQNRVSKNFLVENILNYERRFDKHHLFLTGLYSYQNDATNHHGLSAQGFPNDVLTFYQANVAGQVTPNQWYMQESILSQMLRVNYGFDDRYLLTLTGRRDGYSGFGAQTKWGFFPTVAVGWNISNEDFFGDQGFVQDLKLRMSYGVNGNQAVGPYATLARLRERSYVFGSNTAPGYVVSALGNPNLGWESTTTFNTGLDIGLSEGRYQVTLDVFDAVTDGLLLNRNISPVHGITSVTQNIGRTRNTGIELGINADLIKTGEFVWHTNANFSTVKNQILELYRDGTDDIANNWFIGQPIRVNYDYIFDGVYQIGDDIESSPLPTAQPGYAKLRDITGDGQISPEDRAIQGQRDPIYIWGVNNTFTYKNYSIYFLFQGMHGHQRANELRRDNPWEMVRRNVMLNDWWTPENPTNEQPANNINAWFRGGNIYESLGFVRLKDVSISYDLPFSRLNDWGVNRMRVYLSGRNLLTFTNWTGLDPELNDQNSFPLQREFMLGLNFGF